jgi:hypothetical protein
MSRRPSVFHDLALLFNESAGGVQVTGDSGTGKSTVMALMMQHLARAPGTRANPAPGFLLLDPHGDLCRDAQAYLSSLPERLQRRVVIVHAADTRRKLPGVNPLAVPADQIDELTWRARVIKKSAHTARILLHAWGERDFNGKPLLFKFTSWFLETLGLARLTLPEVRHFFDPSSRVYNCLTRLAPDPIARLELSELGDLRPRDREEFIASTKNRFLGLLKNPLVELSLGKIDGALDARRLIQEGAIVLVNLEPGGVLRDEDREILANLWLSEFLFAAYNTPRERRRPFAVFIDELPLFSASAQLIAANVTQVRKFRLHFCCAHAGTQFFEGGVSNPLLNGITSACRVHIIFRHQGEADATYFGKLVKLPECSATRVKHEQRQPMQFQDGHDLVTLTDTSESWQEGEQQGGSETRGTTETTTDAHGTNSGDTVTRGSTTEEETLRKASSEARAAVVGSSASTSHAAGSTQSASQSWTKTSSRGGGRTFKQTLVPRIVIRDIVTSVQFFTTEEQFMEAASGIASAPVGSALVYVAGSGTVRVRFPLPKKPFRGAPKFGRKKLEQLWRLVTSRPEYALPGDIAAQRAAFTEELAVRLESLIHGGLAGTSSTLPALPGPVSAEHAEAANTARRTVRSSPLPI